VESVGNPRTRKNFPCRGCADGERGGYKNRPGGAVGDGSPAARKWGVKREHRAEALRARDYRGCGVLPLCPFAPCPPAGGAPWCAEQMFLPCIYFSAFRRRAAGGGGWVAVFTGVGVVWTLIFPQALSFAVYTLLPSLPSYIPAPGPRQWQ